MINYIIGIIHARTDYLLILSYFYGVNLIEMRYFD